MVVDSGKEKSEISEHTGGGLNYLHWDYLRRVPCRGQGLPLF